MSLSVIHQAHDKFVKLSLGEPRVALEFFTEHLPASFLKAIDLTTLQLQKQTFIDEHFKNSEADIIYSVQAAQETAYLFLLCEHQSTIDPWIAFRLWVYRIRLMEFYHKQHPKQPLSLVYPLLIYTSVFAQCADLMKCERASNFFAQHAHYHFYIARASRPSDL